MRPVDPALQNSHRQQACGLGRVVAHRAMPRHASDSGSNAPSERQWFATTHWSLVLSTTRSNSSQASEALEKLCRTYWPPLYSYVRRQGCGSEDAQDLTQA